MNIGGEPGRDDYGLPPANVEVPDDARDLEPDVQAYHRELRAQRRRRVARRLFAPLARDGMVLPLLAGCLALTLLAGTLLTVFTAGQRALTRVPHPGSSSSQAGATESASAPQPGSKGSSLPDAPVTVGGQQQSLLALASTGAAIVLALVPADCQCVQSLRLLTREARAAGAQPYLVGMPGGQLRSLSQRAGLGPSHAVEDTQHVLPPAYHPAVLTALLVSVTGRIADRISAADATAVRVRSELKSLIAQAPRAASSSGTPRAATATAGPKLSTPTG